MTLAISQIRFTSARVAAVPDGDVRFEGVVEDEGLLADDVDACAPLLEIVFLDGDAVAGDRPAVRIVHAHQQRHDGRLARAELADERDELPALDVEGDVIKHLLVVVVQERDVVEGHLFDRPRRGGRRRPPCGAPVRPGTRTYGRSVGVGLPVCRNTCRSISHMGRAGTSQRGRSRARQARGP